MLSSNILLFDSGTQDILGKIEKETPLPEFSFLNVVFIQKRIKIRKLETYLIENVIFAIF